jgi:hypothetical protein
VSINIFYVFVLFLKFVFSKNYFKAKKLYCRRYCEHSFGSYTMQNPRLFWVLHLATGLEGRLAICFTDANPTLFPWRSKKRLLAKHSSSHPGDGNS